MGILPRKGGVKLGETTICLKCKSSTTKVLNVLGQFLELLQYGLWSSQEIAIDGKRWKTESKEKG
jgi:hypothetical protein